VSPSRHSVVDNRDMITRHEGSQPGILLPSDKSFPQEEIAPRYVANNGGEQYKREIKVEESISFLMSIPTTLQPL